MANQQHLDILKQGVEAWNQWRKEHTDIPDLRKASIWKADLKGFNLNGADFTEAYLRDADLRDTNLSRADFYQADLTGANLENAYLKGATLVATNLTGATLNNCVVYGIAAWQVELQGTKQENLIITLPDQPTITVDNLEIAQFIFLLLKNKKIRDVIDSITSKVVLILGRFISERKIILDAVKDELRKHDYLPVLFDFDKPASRDITETISTLAHLSRFVIADITDAKSIPQELMTIVPNLPSVPVQPLILNSQQEYGMFEHFTRFPWVLPLYRYTDEVSLLQTLKENVIEPAEQKAHDLAKR